MLVAKAKRTVKNNNRSNKQKQKKLCTCSTLFCTFICRCFARQQSEMSRNSLVTLLWRKCRTCSCSLFFQCRSLLSGWPLAFLIFSPWATRMRKRVGQEIVALPYESFKTSNPPLTPFNKIVTLPQDKIVERLLTNNVLCFFLHIKL